MMVCHMTIFLIHGMMNYLKNYNLPIGHQADVHLSRELKNDIVTISTN